jgi:EAL domain-containing protein (putative c-di-GMP-specific phosphodiesterase class I)
MQQFELLRRLRCNHSQGYLHSVPVAAREIEQMLVPSQRAARAAKVGVVPRT